MLCISRRRGESVRIGDAVITITQLSTGRVQLGIDALAAELDDEEAD